jgi:hypothetical protein
MPRKTLREFGVAAHFLVLFLLGDIDMDDETVYNAIKSAVTAAINEIGLTEFKKCSFFLSNR